MNQIEYMVVVLLTFMPAAVLAQSSGGTGKGDDCFSPRAVTSLYGKALTHVCRDDGGPGCGAERSSSGLVDLSGNWIEESKCWQGGVGKGDSRDVGNSMTLSGGNDETSYRYVGASGRGDDLATCFNKSLSGADTDFVYRCRGGSGRGDSGRISQLSDLSGQVTVDVMSWQGGFGKGDSRDVGNSMTLSGGNDETSYRYVGGSGRGDDLATCFNKSLSGADTDFVYRCRGGSGRGDSERISQLSDLSGQVTVDVMSWQGGVGKGDSRDVGNSMALSGGNDETSYRYVGGSGRGDDLSTCFNKSLSGADTDFVFRYQGGVGKGDQWSSLVLSGLSGEKLDPVYRYSDGTGRGDDYFTSNLGTISGSNVTRVSYYLGGTGKGDFFYSSQLSGLAGDSVDVISRTSGGAGKGDFMNELTFGLSLDGQDMRSRYQGGTGKGDGMDACEKQLSLDGSDMSSRYQGQRGRGDDSELLRSPLSLNGADMRARYHGGPGKGDDRLVDDTWKMLDGTGAIHRYQGGAGRGDDQSVSPLLPIWWYPTANCGGGAGRGDHSGTASFVLGRWTWTGNIDTDWGTGGNWDQLSVPVDSSSVVIPDRENDPLIGKDEQGVARNLEVRAGAMLRVGAGGSLTVPGTLDNQAGTTGVQVLSGITGTGSLLNYTDSVKGTVYRYTGDYWSWNFLSSPVLSQEIDDQSNWTPAGSNSDGTGYELYAWDEPSGSWVSYRSPGWSSIDPGATFTPGRGYLYQMEEAGQTRYYSGTLNNGDVRYAVTSANTGDTLAGLNLVGNPYPSSIDWSADAGYGRDMLTGDNGGYNCWQWSGANQNYGVYNSSWPGTGTNGTGRYIGPGEGFLVQSTSGDNLVLGNACRTNGGEETGESGSSLVTVDITVQSDTCYGGDEVLFDLGNLSNHAGAMKLFSPVETAPGLYLQLGGELLSTSHLTDTIENKYVRMYFRSGSKGKYTMRCRYDQELGTVYLKDRYTGTEVDYSQDSVYRFSSLLADAAPRFLVYFHPGVLTGNADLREARVYVKDGNLIVALEDFDSGIYYRTAVYDIVGRVLYQKMLEGGSNASFPLPGRSVYLVTIRSDQYRMSYKVVY